MSKEKQIDSPYYQIYFKDNKFTVEPTNSDNWVGEFPYSMDGKGRNTTVMAGKIKEGKIALAKCLIEEKEAEYKKIKKELETLNKIISNKNTGS